MRLRHHKTQFVHVRLAPDDRKVLEDLAGFLQIDKSEAVRRALAHYTLAVIDAWREMQKAESANV
jgi:hypothetical protein